MFIGFGAALFLYSVTLCKFASLYRVDAFRKLHEVSLPYWTQAGKYISLAVAVGQHAVFVAHSVHYVDLLADKYFTGIYSVVHFISLLLHASCSFILLLAMGGKRVPFPKVTLWLGTGAVSAVLMSLAMRVHINAKDVWANLQPDPIQISHHDMKGIMRALGMGLFTIASGHWQQIPFKQLSALSPISRTSSVAVASFTAILVYTTMGLYFAAPMAPDGDGTAARIFNEILTPLSMILAQLFMLLSGCQMMHAASEQVQPALIELIGNMIFLKNAIISRCYLAVLTQCTAFYINEMAVYPYEANTAPLFDHTSFYMSVDAVHKGHFYNRPCELIGLFGVGALLVAGPAWMHRCRAARSTRGDPFGVAVDWVGFVLFFIISVTTIADTYFHAFPLYIENGVRMSKHFLRVPILIAAIVLIFKLLCNYFERPRQLSLPASISSTKKPKSMVVLAPILMINTLIFVYLLTRGRFSSPSGWEFFRVSVQSPVLSHFFYAFSHQDPMHFLINTSGIIYLCPLLLRELTTLQFYAFYLAAAVFASASPFVRWFLCRQETPTWGASGAIWAVIGAITYLPQVRLRMLGLPISAPASAFVFAELMLEFLGVMLCRTGMDHIGHILGGLFGLTFYKFFKAL
jgi:membrane associated rhomboid family serine protease